MYIELKWFIILLHNFLRGFYMTGIEKKRNFIINTVYTVIVVALFYLFFKYAFGTLFPFLVAIAAAMILQKPVNFISKKTPIKRGLASVFCVLLGFFALIAVLVLLGIWAGSELKGFVDYIMIQLEDIPAFIDKIEHYLANGLSFLPDNIEHSLTSFVSDKLSSLLDSTDAPAGESMNIDFSSLSTPLLSILDTAKAIPSTLVSILVALIACCFMTSDYKTLRGLVLGFFRPETRDKIVKAKNLLIPSLGKMAKAYGKIISITFCELSLGLGLLKLLGIYEGGYIFIIALGIAIIDIVPVLGTGTVLIPWAVASLLNGNYAMAIGLIIMYVCITVIRQIIEPKLVAAQLGIPAFLMVIAMFMGTKLFGFIGLFLLPITLVMLKLLNDEGIIKLFHFNEKSIKKAEKQPEKEDKND